MTYLLEHIQACNSKPFGPSVRLSIIVALVAPLSASTGVKQHTDKEEINQASAAFRLINLSRPASQKLCHTVFVTHTKVLISSVSRDGGERRFVVSLASC